MLRAVQAVGWGFLDPAPLRLEGPVVALIGQNGSGKSSMLDAIKALLGARRFGQGRTAGSYRFAGRGESPPVERAWIFGVVENDGALERRPQLVTMLMEVSAHRRRYALLDGERLVDPDGDPLAEASAISASLSPSSWMRPAQWEERVLRPLGIGPAMRRLLELPQGEIQRALDRDPQQLLELLIELSGGRAAAERFARAQAALEEARQSHAEQRRRLDRSRRELAERKLAAAEARQAAELRRRLVELGEQAKAALESAPEEPEERPRLLVDPARLRRAGLELELRSGYWRVPEGQKARARELLGPGEAVIAASADVEWMAAEGLLVAGPPAGESEAPPGGLSPRERRALLRVVTRLEEAGIELASGEQPEDPARLIGAFDALAADGVPAAPPRDPEAEIREHEERVRADERELERRSSLIEEAQAQLDEARALYDRAVLRVLGKTAERFAELCRAAGMEGRMQITASRGRAAECRIYAAEAAGEELRPLHGAQASLSGGWRASVVTLAILACLGAEGAPPILLLDEVAASLDEERLAQIGQAFARLGADGGLLTIITVPSKTVSQTVAAFASQQIAFLRPRPGEALAPPPHIVVARRRRLRAA